MYLYVHHIQKEQTCLVVLNLCVCVKELTVARRFVLSQANAEAYRNIHVTSANEEVSSRQHY